MPVADEDMIVKTVDYFVTESNLNPAATSHEIQEFLRKNFTNGNTTFSTGAGGVRRIQVVEKMKLDAGQSNEMRRIVGMDHEIEIDD